MKADLKKAKEKRAPIYLELNNGTQIIAKVSDIREDSVFVTDIYEYVLPPRFDLVSQSGKSLNTLTIKLSAIDVIAELSDNKSDFN